MGSGAPQSTGDICCATFPRDEWDPERRETRFKSTKHCYSKIILRNDASFNYYKAAYCDLAVYGVSAIGLGLASALTVALTF